MIKFALLLTPAISCSTDNLSPVSYVTSDKLLIAGNNNAGGNLSHVTTTPAMKQLQQYQLAYISKWTLSKTNDRSVNSNPTASQQNIEKHPGSKLFTFIAGVIDTGDQPLHMNISTNFRKNSKLPQ
jgi:hypothetical protein